MSKYLKFEIYVLSFLLCCIFVIDVSIEYFSRQVITNYELSNEEPPEPGISARLSLKLQSTGNYTLMENGINFNMNGMLCAKALSIGEAQVKVVNEKVKIYVHKRSTYPTTVNLPLYTDHFNRNNSNEICLMNIVVSAVLIDTSGLKDVGDCFDYERVSRSNHRWVACRNVSPRHWAMSWSISRRLENNSVIEKTELTLSST